jgi:hypothetical protein
MWCMCVKKRKEAFREKSEEGLWARDPELVLPGQMRLSFALNS